MNNEVENLTFTCLCGKVIDIWFLQNARYVDATCECGEEWLVMCPIKK